MEWVHLYARKENYSCVIMSAKQWRTYGERREKNVSPGVRVPTTIAASSQKSSVCNSAGFHPRLLRDKLNMGWIS